MKTIKKIRAIIYSIKDNEPYFLVFHRILRWRGWEVLKGTIEKKENIKQAIIREIKEETGLNKFEIIKRLGIKENWQAKGNNYRIIDTFLVKADMKEKISLKQDITEHDKYAWADKKTVIKKLTWPKTKAIIKKLNNKLLV